MEKAVRLFVSVLIEVLLFVRQKKSWLTKYWQKKRERPRDREILDFSITFY